MKPENSKVMLSEELIIDINAIVWARREPAVTVGGDVIEGKFITAFRVIGVEKSLLMSGTVGDLLWKILCADAAPLYEREPTTPN